MSLKIERLSNQIVKEISYILAREIKDKEIEFVTVTACKLASDESYAKIYITVLDQNKRESTVKALNNAASFIRLKLGERVQMRHIPELSFVYDESIEYANKIETIIEQIHEEK